MSRLPMVICFGGEHEGEGYSEGESSNDQCDKEIKVRANVASIPCAGLGGLGP